MDEHLEQEYEDRFFIGEADDEDGFFWGWASDDDDDGPFWGWASDDDDDGPF